MTKLYVKDLMESVSENNHRDFDRHYNFNK